MKRFLIFLVLIGCSTLVMAQSSYQTDSLKKFDPGDALMEPELAIPAATSLSMSEFQLFKPDFGQKLFGSNNQIFDFSSLKLGLNKGIVSSSTSSFTGFYPYFANQAVFNQSTYRLNDRFTIGGGSFGARSLIGKPVLNPTISDMDIKGASLFFQYKISDKVRIETRVSVSDRKSPFIP